MSHVISYKPLDGFKCFYGIHINDVYVANVYIKRNLWVMNPEHASATSGSNFSDLRNAVITRYNRSFKRFERAERIASSLSSLRRHIRKENPALCSFIGVTNTSDYKRLSVKIKKSITEE